MVVQYISSQCGMDENSQHGEHAFKKGRCDVQVLYSFSIMLGQTGNSQGEDHHFSSQESGAYDMIGS